MRVVDFDIPELKSMKKYPDKLYVKGNIELLKRPKISIVGTRRPSAYTKRYTYELAKSISSRGVTIVSGAAMGVDAIAHQGATTHNTIAVMANSLNFRYPSVNKNLIEDIEKNGLTISQFESDFRATAWSFVLRNEIVVSLGESLIITEADEDSGSMRSAEYAIKMGKKIYVLPHQLGDSSGTNQLLRDGLAEPIYDIERFASQFGQAVECDIPKDDFFYFCQKSPTLDETIENFGDRIYEAELDGLVKIENGLVKLV
ncbi:Rossmann fold nucleotide-binding protein Smf possibly involved in DNA uptake [hydrothermal vent metagenome]|uniref:Rossmann fold nucleotide-binding protein Smf possibly involved in DNA uptake n=1 Tax=hydrothermal vent metagenome TaxID=652676 RepID=A0A1W1BI12_9ZZZZ